MFRKWLGGLSSGFRLWDAAACRVVKASVMLSFMMLGLVFSEFKIWGTFYVTCLDPSGGVKWRAIAPNSVVNTGLNHILNVAFCSATQITSWYIGLVDNASFTAFAAADTHALHGGWVECTTYSQSTRVAWTTVTSTAQSVTNTSTSNFSINATKTVKGLFVSSVSTKGDTGTGTLASEAAFSGGNQSVSNGDTLQVTYTLNAASS